MKLEIVPGNFSVVRMGSKDKIPSAVLDSPFYTISKSPDELSIVCESDLAPDGFPIESDFGLIKVYGPLDFSLTGILASIASPLAEAEISLLAISTFDTDYVLVRQPDLEKTKEVLVNSGFHFQ